MNNGDYIIESGSDVSAKSSAVRAPHFFFEMRCSKKGGEFRARLPEPTAPAKPESELF